MHTPERLEITTLLARKNMKKDEKIFEKSLRSIHASVIIIKLV